ncbi:MAG: NrpR regulatory domain-containing protein [Dehalococcoidales bacterium]|nr:NrpR regulatory domain-containing protein [Dehalococcoidales bacterium]
MSFEVQDVERKMLAILKVLESFQKPTGARVIAQNMASYGVTLGERAVRYHLRLMDERGLTELVGNQDGRIITPKGLAEIRNALVKDKVGFAISRIEMLACRTQFDHRARRGVIPMNISVFPEEKFNKALQAMKPAFDAGLCVSDLVAVAKEGERLGDILIPAGKVGLATVCSIVLNGTLLKAGVPMNSRFGGLLQMRNGKPLRFVELIGYAGCSLDPSEIFIRAKMTSVGEVARSGDGTILANFREIPSVCRASAEEIVSELNKAGLKALLVMADTGAPVCEVPVEFDKIGMVLLGGLNPVAAAEEAGILAENHAMSTLMEYGGLTRFQELLK